MRGEPRGSDHRDENDARTQEGLAQIPGETGKSEREKNEKEERVNLHQENAHRIMKGRETRIMQEEELDGNEGDGDENEDEKEFGEQEFGPLVGLGDPPLAIADEGIGLNNTDDKEGPEGHQDRTDDFCYLGNNKRFDVQGSIALQPEMQFSTGEEGQEGEGDQDFGAVAAGVFFEDVEDLVHGCLDG